MNEYNPSIIESKWQDVWKKSNEFEPSDDKSLKKKYVLSMFPYPSGQLHMGHVRNYCISDCIARYYRQKNYNVLHPIGWDAFGMPAENAAIKHKIHPKKWTYENIANMREEINSLGISFSQDREFATCDPIYTKFEQKIFLDMYKKGIIYKKKGFVNWCPNDKTVLAHEQVEDGCCWRCGTNVVKKEMEQYYANITSYGDELLEDLKLLEGKWPDKVLNMQKNWIGKSTGLEFTFELDEKSKQKLNNKFTSFDVFTTRADTIYGVTYTALAVEHKIVQYLLENNLLDENTKEFVNRVKNQKNVQRESATKEGCYLGIDVIHPLTGEIIPIWSANFVLADYGSGAVMAVPAHDDRDFEFASKYNLNIKQVVDADGIDISKNAYIKNGTLINSDTFDGSENTQAKDLIIEYFEKNKIGKKITNYRLRDWCISRQRYWGSVIPLIKCEKCGTLPQDEESLPVLLPDDVEITGESGNPISTHPSWKNCKCPKCGSDALRETDTMDTFIQSSWYFLRYVTSKKEGANVIFKKEDIDYWLDVDHYIGGVEHAIMHLLYARFFTKVLRDLDYINIKEPFSKLLTQGMVLKDGIKMSKSKGNIVQPNDIIKDYGSDSARLFTLFAAPPTKELEWNDNAVDGCYKFLKKFYAKSFLCSESFDIKMKFDKTKLNKKEKIARKKIYQTLLKSEDVYSKTFAFNTLIASCMETLNALSEQENNDIFAEGYYVMSKVLEPIVPHIASEISQRLFNLENINSNIDVDNEALEDDSIELAITINGKKRDIIEVPKDETKENIIALAKDKTAKWLEDKTIVKEIYVPNKLVNIVIKP